ncbi:MAG TPA: hypothetical protein VMS99_16990 [Acidimicrobiia bacterium]|nr:hypothetical protein [Acidimicrobiia bacterium]
MLDIVEFGDRLISVGYSSIDKQADGRVWTSTDGVAWEAYDDPDLGGPDDQWITAITVGGPGLVAVGFEGRIELGNSDTDAAIWTSSDGLHWDRALPNRSLGGRRSQELWTVAAFDGRLLAGGGDRGSAAVWTSTDGVSWNRVIGPNRFLGSRQGRAIIRGMTVGGPGIIAVGEADNDAAIWTSSDGENWSRVNNPGVLGGEGSQGIANVIDSQLGLVAVGFDLGGERINFLGRGSEEDMDGVVWISEDGLLWQRVDSPAFGGPGFQELTDIVRWGDGLVAVGRDIPGGVRLDDPAADVDAGIWFSEDGVSWSKVESRSLGGPGWQDIFGIAVSGSRLVAVGGDDSGSS